MAKKPLPCPTLLRQLLRYDPHTGKLFWRERPADMFFDLRAAKIWNARFAGKEAFTADNGKGYRKGAIFDVTQKAHRVIWAMETGAWPENQIDHINGNRSDNRFLNLRSVTNAENTRNARCREDNTSGSTGVSWHKKRAKWHVQIKVDGRNLSIGFFSDFDAAVAARKLADIEHGYHENHGRKQSHEIQCAFNG